MLSPLCISPPLPLSLTAPQVTAAAAAAAAAAARSKAAAAASPPSLSEAAVSVTSFRHDAAVSFFSLFFARMSFHCI